MLIGLFLLSTGLMYLSHIKKKEGDTRREKMVSLGLLFAGAIIMIMPFLGVMGGNEDKGPGSRSLLKGPDVYGPGLRKSTKDHAAAVEFYEKAVALYDLNIPGFTSVDSARMYLNKSLENYETAEALTAFGQLKVQIGNMQGAMEDFERAVLLKPDFGNAYFHMAAIHYINKDIPQACENWSKAIENGNQEATGLYSSFCN